MQLWPMPLWPNIVMEYCSCGPTLIFGHVLRDLCRHVYVHRQSAFLTTLACSLGHCDLRTFVATAYIVTAYNVMAYISYGLWLPVHLCPRIRHAVGDADIETMP